MFESKTVDVGQTIEVEYAVVADDVGIDELQSVHCPHYTRDDAFNVVCVFGDCPTVKCLAHVNSFLCCNDF